MADRDRSVAYRRLAAWLRDAIRAGEYPEGGRLPTEEQLATSYSLSRQTVRRAMQDLVAEGIIYRVPGRGTYPVAEQDRQIRPFSTVEELTVLGGETECEIIAPMQRRAEAESAARLRLLSDDVFVLEMVRRRESVPFCYTSVFLPPRVARLIGDARELSPAGRRSRVTVVGLIDAKMSAFISSAEQSFKAVGAPPAAARYLGCQPGDPVLCIDHLYSDASDDPVELAVSYFSPEHYSYRLRLRRRPTMRAGAPSPEMMDSGNAKTS
jgi:DNA-binding GntR family transcriptional regulator